MGEKELICDVFFTGSLEEDYYASWPGASGRGVGDYDFRRRPRSYRSDRESKPIALANTVGPGGLVGAAVPSRLASSSSFSGSAIPDKSDALFATENSTVVTAQIGSTANLPCVVKNLGNGVVSTVNEKFFSIFSGVWKPLYILVPVIHASRLYSHIDYAVLYCVRILGSVNSGAVCNF